MKQWNRQSRQLLLLLGIVVVCAAVYLALFLFNRQAEEEDDTVYLTQMDDVTALSFYNGEQTLSFTKVDGQWQWDGDDAFPTDQSDLTSLADTAGQLAAVRTFETPESADAYGLDAPAYEITLTAGDGESVTVLIGNSADSNYYAQVDGQVPVYTIASTLVDDMNVDLMDLAQVETFPSLSEDNMETISIQKEGQTMTFTKATDTQTDEDSGESTTTYTWSLDGTEIPEDNTALSGMLSDLSYLYFSSCYDYQSDAQERTDCGLDDPVTITVTCSDGTAMKLEVGAATPEGDSYYAVLDSSQAIHRISSTALGDLLTLTADSFQ